jgi:ABC-2 type transport system permease protein
MGILTAQGSLSRVQTDDRSATMPFLAQVSMLTWRSLVTIFRDPASIIPGLIISVFFLLVYDASLSGAAAFFLRGQSYLGFILPLSVISSALSGASLAGQAIVRDIETGYFNKLLLTPVSRSALLLGPMIASALVLVLQAGLVIAVALVMGLQPATGVLGLLGVLGFALFIGIGFAGFVVGIALQTGSPAATGSATFLFFPLSFLTATFTPLNLLNGWIRVAAELNPITYILGATRAMLNEGWQPELIAQGLLACTVISILTFTFAWFSLRGRTRQK